MSTTPVIRVMCVEDHRIVREGLALIINQEPDMEMVGSCATIAEAIDVYRSGRPDGTLMDLRLGTASGVDAIKAKQILISELALAEKTDEEKASVLLDEVLAS